MARHPEIKEKDIIEAGIALEEKGKMPNLGAIRAPSLATLGCKLTADSSGDNFN